MTSPRPYVLIVGDPYPEYTRSRSLKSALDVLGFDVSRARRRGIRPAAVLVPYPGWKYLPQAKAHALLARCPLILDNFISVTETRAVERGKSRLVATLYWVAESLLLLLPQVLVYDTSGSRETGRRYAWRPRQRRLVVPVTTGIGELTRRAPRPAGEPLHVVWYGTFSELHGTDVIAQAAQRVRRPLRLTVIGGGRLETRTEWPESVAVLPTQTIESLTDFIDDADVVLGVFGGTGKADHVIPNKVVDGLAAGKAVVTQRASAIERIEAAGALLVVAPRDPQALADALDRLCDGRALVAELGGRGRAFYEAEMSPERVVAAFAPALGLQPPPSASS